MDHQNFRGYETVHPLGVAKPSRAKPQKMPKIFGVEKPKKWTVFPAISIFSGIWNFFLDGFEPDSSCSADSKKLWVYDDQTCSKAQKCILVRALASTSQKCLQPITMLHSDIHVISLVPDFFFKKTLICWKNAWALTC